LGSHGRSGVSRLLLGSVTEKILHKAPCPTMIVPPAAPGAAAKEPVRFRSVLCPIDFSKGSDAALQVALLVAQEADARLTLLHVIEAPPELYDSRLASMVDVGRIREAAEAERRGRLDTLVP